MASYRIEFKPSFKRDLKAIVLCDACYPQSKRQSLSATIHDANRPRGLAVARGHVSPDMHTKFRRHHSFLLRRSGIETKSKNDSLQNEANISAWRGMHDKASYQLLKLVEVVIEFSVGFPPTLL